MDNFFYIFHYSWLHLLYMYVIVIIKYVNTMDFKNLKTGKLFQRSLYPYEINLFYLPNIIIEVSIHRILIP